MSLEGLPTSNSPRKIDHPKCTILTKDTAVLDVVLQKYFKDSFLDDVICENCISGGSESTKSTFTVSRYLKKPPSFLKILFLRRNYDMTNYVATKNEPKVAITSEYFYKQPLINEKISHTLVSLINHDGNQLNCGQYVSDVFDCSTGILCHCDDDNITQMSDLPKVIYYRETHKHTKKKNIMMAGSTDVFFVVYIRKIHLTKHSSNCFQ